MPDDFINIFNAILVAEKAKGADYDIIRISLQDLSAALAVCTLATIGRAHPNFTF